MDSNKKGRVVMNGDESSLVSRVKEKQDQDPIFLELKRKTLISKKWCLLTMGDGVLRYQGRLFTKGGWTPRDDHRESS